MSHSRYVVVGSHFLFQLGLYIRRWKTVNIKYTMTVASCYLSHLVGSASKWSCPENQYNVPVAAKVLNQLKFISELHICLETRSCCLAGSTSFTFAVIMVIKISFRLKILSGNHPLLSSCLSIRERWMYRCFCGPEVKIQWSIVRRW